MPETVTVAEERLQAPQGLKDTSGRWYTGEKLPGPVLQWATDPKASTQYWYLSEIETAKQHLRDRGVSADRFWLYPTQELLNEGEFACPCCLAEEFSVHYLMTNVAHVTAGGEWDDRDCEDLYLLAQVECQECHAVLLDRLTEIIQALARFGAKLSLPWNEEHNG